MHGGGPWAFEKGGWRMNAARTLTLRAVRGFSRHPLQSCVRDDYSDAWPDANVVVYEHIGQVTLSSEKY
jgi:hypothetical protein